MIGLSDMNGYQSDSDVDDVDMDIGGDDNARPYRCTFDGCNRAYTKPCRLEEHQRTHTGERPYECKHDGCGKSYMRENHLKRHELIHSGTKPFACTHQGCTAAYHTSYHLKRHTAVHEKTAHYVVCELALLPYQKKKKELSYNRSCRYGISSDASVIISLHIITSSCEEKLITYVRPTVVHVLS